MSGILSAEDLEAIRERVETATPTMYSPSFSLAYEPFVRNARTDVPALLASHEALKALAVALAVTLQERTCCSVDWPQSAALLAKARAAGLLEADDATA